MIEDVPEEGESVEHVERRDRRPGRLHGARGHADRPPPLGRGRRLALQRRPHEPDARARARRARGGRRRAGRGHDRAGARARSSCRSRRWRSRRRAATRASSRSARSCAARRRTSTTSRARPPPACSSPRSRPACRSRSACSRSRRSSRARRGSTAPATPCGRALEMADLFAQLRASAAQLTRRLTVAADRRAATLAGRCRRSAQSVARSPGSGTTARTRWSRPTGGSTRTSSASACS